MCVPVCVRECGFMRNVKGGSSWKEGELGSDLCPLIPAAANSTAAWSV